MVGMVVIANGINGTVLLIRFVYDESTIETL
jgi:hypothetical protein